MHLHKHVLSVSPHMPPFCDELVYETSLHSSCISLMVLRAPLHLCCMRSMGTMSTTYCVGGNVVLRSLRRAKSTKAMPRRCKNQRHWRISCGIRVTCWMRWGSGWDCSRQTSIYLYVFVYSFAISNWCRALSINSISTMLWIASTSVEGRRCSDPWRDAKASRLWVGQCTGFSCNSQQNWLNHILIMFFCWSIVVDQFFFRFVFDLIPCSIWLLWICTVWFISPCHCVDDPDIHFHPYSPKGYASISTLYPLYSIPGILQQSGLEQSFRESASHARAMGNCSTCLFGRDKEVGVADDGECVVHRLCWERVGNDLWQRFQMHDFLPSAASNDL